MVKNNPTRKINFTPQIDAEEILQNISTILSTPKFSVPLDRGFGLAQRFLDMPIQTAKTVLVSEILDAVERYEPRASVISVDFEKNEIPGKLIPIVEVEILDRNR